MKIIKLDESSKKEILRNLIKRSPGQYREYEDKVAAIVGDVRERGDEAIFEYTKKFDGFDLSPANILVTQAEIDDAYEKAGEKSCCEHSRFSRASKGAQLVRDSRGRDLPRTESHSLKTCRRLCARRQSSISFVGTYECDPRESCGRR